jgi:hypothetical protein
MADSPTMLSCGIDGALSGAIDAPWCATIGFDLQPQPWLIPHSALMRRYNELSLVVCLAPSLIRQSDTAKRHATYLLALPRAKSMVHPLTSPPVSGAMTTGVRRKSRGSGQERDGRRGVGH